MPRIRTITTMAELSAGMMAAFNAINAKFYNGELEKPIITFKEGARKSAYGWIETHKQWVQGQNERYEINISIDYIEFYAIGSTVVISCFAFLPSDTNITKGSRLRINKL